MGGRSALSGFLPHRAGHQGERGQLSQDTVTFMDALGRTRPTSLRRSVFEPTSDFGWVSRPKLWWLSMDWSPPLFARTWRMASICSGAGEEPCGCAVRGRRRASASRRSPSPSSRSMRMGTSNCAGARTGGVPATTPPCERGIRRARADGWDPVVFGHDLQNAYRQWAVKYPGHCGTFGHDSLVQLRHVLRGGGQRLELQPSGRRRPDGPPCAPLGPLRPLCGEDELTADFAHVALADFLALLGLQTKPSKAQAPTLLRAFGSQKILAQIDEALPRIRCDL